MKSLEQLGISPAPWKRTGDRLVANANHDPVDGTTASTIVVETKSGSDARLIAAAPELYEALRTLVYINENGAKEDMLIPAAWQYAKIALAKAVGEIETVTNCNQSKEAN